MTKGQFPKLIREKYLSRIRGSGLNRQFTFSKKPKMDTTKILAINRNIKIKNENKKELAPASQIGKAVLKRLTISNICNSVKGTLKS